MTARTLAEILDTGLGWLYDTVQPDNAHQHNHGVMLPASGNRTYRFIPVGARNRPVVVVDVTKVDWIDNGPTQLMTPANPLKAGELETLAAELERRGFPAEATWNGHPGVTGSVGLVQPAHSSQVASVARYRAGCQAHPERSVFCDCEAWNAGFARAVHAAPAAVSAAGGTR